MEEPPADEDPPLDGDEEELGDEGEEERRTTRTRTPTPTVCSAPGGARPARPAMRAAALILFMHMDVIVELTEATLEELADNRKLHQLRYPTYLASRTPTSSCARPTGCARPRARAQGTRGRPRRPCRAAAAPPPRAAATLRPARRQELDLSGNKLMVLDGLEQFSTLKVLRAARNQITEVTIEKLPRLKILDLSHNKPMVCPTCARRSAEPGSAAAHHLPPHGRRRCRSAAAAARVEARATPSIRRRQVRLQGAHLC